MKKIAFIIRLFQEKNFHGGGEKLFSNLIKRFISENCEIDIYCSQSDIFEAEGINKIIVLNSIYNHLNPETMENFYDEIKNIIKDKDYDFVISENITPPIDITFLQGHSVINRLVNTKGPLEAFFYNFRKVKLNRIKYQNNWMKQGYRKIFTVSEILKKDIIENFDMPEDNISVIYPGVDIPKDIPSSDFDENKTVTFGLSAPGFKIKGGFIFLKALRILKINGYDFKAKIIYPKFKKNFWVKLLVKLYNIESNIEFLCYQENIQDFYRSIDCLAAPSIEDTFNLAVLEAMANKIPCIVSKNAGASEILQDEQNGFVFEMKENPEMNLAAKMVYFIENTDKICNIKENAFETAKYYSWQRTFDNFSEELKNIPKRNPPFGRT